MNGEIRLAKAEPNESLCGSRDRSWLVINRARGHSRFHLCLNELRLFGGEKQGARHCLPDLSAFPPPLHNSRARVTVGTQQQMADFVGDDATQNDRSLERCVVSFGGAQRVVVVDAGENRNDCSAEDSILKPVL